MDRRILLGLALATALCAPAWAQDKSIVVASTTSTMDSGLFGHLRRGVQCHVVGMGKRKIGYLPQPLR